MIQGVAAAYARSPRKFSASPRFPARLPRRNLAPILGEGGFLCCASQLHCAAPDTL